MAKKLIDIERDILKSSEDFYLYLQKILPPKVLGFLEEIEKYTEVYLFSGAIRNYFIGKKDEKLRDIDFVIIDKFDIENLFSEYSITKNSFDGYKIIIDDLTIDLWVMERTWGLNYGQLTFEFNKLEYLPNTTFFNFSSILYSMNNKYFIVGKPFLKFLRDKTLDVVLEENPFPSLCIVNSFYYSEKYKLKFSEKLAKFITTNYLQHFEKLDEIQMKHFGEIKYSKKELSDKVQKL